MLYADPGSGAMVWQLLLALFFGATFYFSRLKDRVALRLNNRKEIRRLDSIEPDYSTETLPSTSKGK